MNEHEKALDTVLGWAGRKPPRELMVAVIFAGIITNNLKAGPGSQDDIGKRSVAAAASWADTIIAYCEEHPPT